MLGYEDSKYSVEFSGSDKKTRDDLCVCTSVAQFEPDPNPVSYVILNKEEALSKDPRISWVNTCAHRYITDNEDLAFALASLKDDDTTDKYQFLRSSAIFSLILAEMCIKREHWYSVYEISGILILIMKEIL